MTTRLLLIRHGAVDGMSETLNGRCAGIVLNDEGRRQAQKLAVYLADFSIQAVFSSPQPRAMDTARELGLPVQVSGEIDEIDFGAWTGCRFDDLELLPEWRLFNSVRSTIRPPGGEAIWETQARMVRLLECVRARFAGGIAAVVSHADPLKCAICHYVGLGLDLMQRLEISPGSLSELVFDGGEPRLARLNETAWL